MPYTGASSIFVRVLLTKKYSLPLRVIAALAEHFASFASETRTLPVLWHQSLLVFAQRYKAELTAAQREQLRVLLRAQAHPYITPEIRRELFQQPPGGGVGTTTDVCPKGVASSSGRHGMGA